jgi:molecular chaperone DnaJ
VALAVFNRGSSCMKKDYYLLLHLTPEASTEEIRSAYRRRALELHPDQSGSGSDPFLELQEAYTVLSDPARRARYDRKTETIPVHHADSSHYRTTKAGRGYSAEPLTPVQPAGGFEDVALFRSFETFSPSFEEIFERLWSNFDLLTRPKEERLESLTVDVSLSPEEAFAGGAVHVMVPARAICPACRGRGSVGPYECWRCEGHGALTGEYPVMVSYPAGLQDDYTVRLSLDRFGIENFYLIVRFRPTAAVW